MSSVFEKDAALERGSTIDRLEAGRQLFHGFQGGNGPGDANLKKKEEVGVRPGTDTDAGLHRDNGKINYPTMIENPSERTLADPFRDAIGANKQNSGTRPIEAKRVVTEDARAHKSLFQTRSQRPYRRPDKGSAEEQIERNVRLYGQTTVSPRPRDYRCNADALAELIEECG